MSVTVALAGSLREHAGGAAEVRLAAAPGTVGTVGEALAALFAAHPGLRDRIVGETGQVRRHVNVFVGRESIRDSGGLETPVAEGAEITILPAVSGG
jgi:molybdopterin converting factor small subunit